MANPNFWRLNNRERHDDLLRKTQLQRKFGLTVADYDKMVDDHEGVCAICRQPCKTGRRLAIDHCHGTGAIRGLLCQNCNIGLGKFQDDPALLKAAADYLLKSSNPDANLRLIHSDGISRVIPEASQRSE